MAGRPWTERELEVLEELYGTVPVEVIAKRLDRTVAAVYVRTAKLHLGPQRPSDVLVASEVMAITGIDSHPTFVRWVREGRLVAERKPHAFSAAKRPEWWVRQADLERFLGEHPHLVDRDRIDPVFRQFVPGRWVTLVEAFRRGAAHPNLLENAVKAGLVPEARKRGDAGTRWAIPETIVPALVAARRRMTTDTEHRRLVVAYDRLQRRSGLARGRTQHVAMARRMSDGGQAGRRREVPAA